MDFLDEELKNVLRKYPEAKAATATPRNCVVVEFAIVDNEESSCARDEEGSEREGNQRKWESKRRKKKVKEN